MFHAASRLPQEQGGTSCRRGGAAKFPQGSTSGR